MDKIKESLECIKELKEDSARIKSNEKEALNSLVDYVTDKLEHPINIKHIQVEHTFDTYDIEDINHVHKTSYSLLLNKLIKENILEYEACELSHGLRGIKVVFSVDVIDKEIQNGKTKEWSFE